MFCFCAFSCFSGSISYDVCICLCYNAVLYYTFCYTILLHFTLLHFISHDSILYNIMFICCTVLLHSKLNCISILFLYSYRQTLSIIIYHIIYYFELHHLYILNLLTVAINHITVITVLLIFVLNCCIIVYIFISILILYTSDYLSCTLSVQLYLLLSLCCRNNWIPPLGMDQ